MENKQKEILVIKLNAFLNIKDTNRLYKSIMAQRENGLIVIPPYCEALIVPEDVKVKVEGCDLQFYK